MRKFFKNSQKNYVEAIFSFFWSNLEKNEFSWKLGFSHLGFSLYSSYLPLY